MWDLLMEARKLLVAAKSVGSSVLTRDQTWATACLGSSESKPRDHHGILMRDLYSPLGQEALPAPWGWGDFRSGLAMVSDLFCFHSGLERLDALQKACLGRKEEAGSKTLASRTLFRLRQCGALASGWA